MFNGKEWYSSSCLYVCLCDRLQMVTRFVRSRYAATRCDHCTPDELVDEWKARRFQLQPWPVSAAFICRPDLSCPPCRGRAIIHRCGIYERKELAMTEKRRFGSFYHIYSCPWNLQPFLLQPKICFAVESIAGHWHWMLVWDGLLGSHSNVQNFPYYVHT